MAKMHLSTVCPNKYLQQARLLQGWSQADVAGRIGTDGNTVNRWERGRAKPSPYFRQKLCDLFEKSALELGFIPTHPKSPMRAVSASGDYQGTPYWHIPYRRNLLFTGREGFLPELHDRVVKQARSYALCGLGGIGKTQTVIEYAYKYASHYSAIFWVKAENPERITASYLTIARLLQLIETQEADHQQIIASVQHWLATNKEWLLIWDNLENLKLMYHFLPLVHQGTILITTQKCALGDLAFPLELPPLSTEAGTRLLLSRAKMFPTLPSSGEMLQLALQQPKTYAAAQEVATLLGGLPLALDQAGAYIEETGCDFADYLQRYAQLPLQLMDRRGNSDEDHPLSTTATINLSHQSLAQQHPLAAELLGMCVFLNTEVIPEEIFITAPSPREIQGELLATDTYPADTGAVKALLTNPYQLDLEIAAIRNFSLIQRHAETRTLSIHRMVKTILQAQMSPQELTQRQQV